MAEHYYYSIASGSSGNCGLYMADGTAILIDLGVSLRRITTALKALSLTLEDISAVVLTHEHIDHVNPVIYTDIFTEHTGYRIYNGKNTVGF